MKDVIASLLAKETGIPKEELEKFIEIPPSSELGDYAFPCFSLAKQLKKSPAQIAQEISKKLKTKDFEKVEAKGSYINFFLDRKSLAEETLTKVLKEEDKFGQGKEKAKLMIEFSQANTHKAFHVGHIRGTSIGESLARILEFSGNKVIRANYQGDTGMHVAKWIWCYLNYHKKEKLVNDESWVASIYVDAVKRLAKDENLQEEVNKVNKKLEEGKDKDLMELWKKTRELSLESFEKIYKELNTHFDKYYFEREVEKAGKEIAKELVKKEIAKVSDEAVIMDLNEFGLSVWVLLRKDGTVLYSSKDLALVERKFKENKLDRCLYVVADEQNLHFQQLLKTLELMKFKDREKCQHVHFAMVRLPTGKMSSRTGDNILYSDFIREMKEYAKEEILKREKISLEEAEERALAISIAAIKYSMLKQGPNNVIVFNKEEALNFEGDTGPYLLYSYARAKSILRKANYKPKNLSIEKIEENEKQLINEFARFPEVVKSAYSHLAPNLIANYSYHLSQKFNEFYHTNKVIGSDEEQFRLSLVDAFSIVLKNALSLLGISVIEKM
jgi:arginyl-tRNA synthetase